MTEGITSETRKKISKQKIIIKHKERRTSTSEEMLQEKKEEKRKPTKALRKKEKRKKDIEGGETQENGNSYTGKKLRRDFCSDLDDYVREWTDREQNGSWKFNKNLQTYALHHCLDVQIIQSPLFNKLVPYINSVVGISRSRLLEQCQRKIEEFESLDEGERKLGDDGDDLVTSIARANLLLKILSSV